jgi:hypothetical protein
LSANGGEYYIHDNNDSNIFGQSNGETSRQSDYVMEESEIRGTICDLENQRVVRADAERTRGSE